MINKNYTAFFGKQNLLSSFNNWLVDTVEGGQIGFGPLQAGKDFYWAFDYPIAPQQTPAINLTEVGLFNMGEMAFDKLLDIDVDGDPIYGQRNQTLIQIECVDTDKDTYTSATKKVRTLRDRVYAALMTETIPFRNYNDPNKPQIGVIELDTASNTINEKFIVDPVNQNVKRHVLLVRIFWMEIFNRVKTKTISSNAEIV